MALLLRLFLGGAVAAVAVIFLYAPADRSAEHFGRLLAAEHQANVEMWGSRYGERVLERMRWLRGEATRNWLPGELGKPLEKRAGAAADQTAVGRSSSEVTSRLMHNEYFRSIDALLSLAAYRAAMVIELLPLFLPFLAVSIVDGAVERACRSKAFVPHKPGVYGVFVGGLLLTLSMFLVLFVLPTSVTPLAAVTGIVLAGLLAGRSIAHFLKHA